ncbi:hypothetical protein GEMRC1_006914 [Eukaryota sp. GEM-RC1]
MADFEQKLNELKTLQDEASTLYSTRTKYVGQLTENEMVLEELELLGGDEDSKVYKLAGPVLLPQDLEESKAMVTSRIGFMKRELSTIESKLEEFSEKERKLTMYLQEVQSRQTQKAK